MNPFYSVMGIVSWVSGKMSRFSVNFIPSNWGLMAGCGIFGLLCLDEYNRSHDIYSLVFCVLLWLTAALFLLSSLRLHTIFQPQAPSPVGPTDVGANFDGTLVLTGKLHLQDKGARRFLAVPAHLITLENGSPAFASNIDASSRMYGVTMSERRGMWLSVPRPGTLQVEDGLFYHGFKGKPALRLRFVDELDGSQNTIITAFNSPSLRAAARAQLNGQGQIQAPLNTIQAPLSSPFSS